MFDALSKGFDKVNNYFVGRTKFSAENIQQISQIIKESLIESDVEVSVIDQFLIDVTNKAYKLESNLKHKKIKLTKKKTLTDRFMLICFDHLSQLLGNNPYDLSLKGDFNTIMLMGLQGVGKTTTCAKLANYFKDKKPMLVACDIYRPAAVDQLKTLGQSIDVPMFYLPDQTPQYICEQAKKHALSNGNKLMIVDTAGRLSIDEKLMVELKSLKKILDPKHNLLVVDTMMGQDAVESAKNFNQSIEVDGFILTKFDGDAPGGAALSITHVTKKPIAMIGTGEAIENIDIFEPKGISSQILGMGDFSGLTRELQEFENIEQAGDQEFDFNMFLKYAQLLHKGKKFRSILGKLPGKLGEKFDFIDQSELTKSTIAIMQSMTAEERTNTLEFNRSRVSRIAKGSGVSFQKASEFIGNMRRMLKYYQNFKSRNNHKDHGLSANTNIIDVDDFSPVERAFLDRDFFGFKKSPSQLQKTKDSDASADDKDKDQDDNDIEKDKSAENTKKMMKLKYSKIKKNKAKNKAKRKSSLVNRKKR